LQIAPESKVLLLAKERWARVHHAARVAAADGAARAARVVDCATIRVTLEARAATSTIPIVMLGAGGPVGTGLVASLAPPGGNVTGLSLLVPELSGKRLALLTKPH
jgi:ABC-type uncharacterized transport system substrate-binding protein